MADTKKKSKTSTPTGDQIDALLRKVPVPIPGSSANVLGLAQDRIMEALKRISGKDKQKGKK